MVHRARPSVPILMYHELAPTPRPEFRRFTVAPGEFAWQMGWLARRGFTTVGLGQLAAAREGRGRLPARPVVITFDDGFADSARFALPTLRRYGFTATFFLVAGLVGRDAEWLEREVGFRLPLMDWDTARALQDVGCDIGSHTVSHPRLATLSPKACREELVRSRTIVEDALGRSVRHLAYPFGSHDERVVALAREAGYLTACTTLEGRSGSEDLLTLRRIPIYGTESRMDFVSRLLTAQPLAPMVRNALGTLRRRVRMAVRGALPG